MNKKLLKSLLIVAVAAIIIIGGTIAYFSDTETSTGNKFTAGKFNLQIDNTCHYNGKVCMCDGEICQWQGTDEACFCTWEAKDLTNELFFNLGDVKPGDFGEDTISLHIDNNDAWMCAEIANLKNNDNGCENPEFKAETSAYGLGNETCGNSGLGQGELQSSLLFSVWKDNGTEEGHACNNIKDSDEIYIFENQSGQEESWTIADATTGTPIPGGATICYGVKWSLPIEVNNIIQTDDFSEDVIFTAVQARNMNNFKCSDLTDNGVAEECSSDSDCNDEIYCNGLETCNAQHVCLSSENPCPGQNVGPNCNDSCNEANDDCTADDVDGISCTGGLCQSGICNISCTPTAEVCNGLDDNCNQVVDEGNPGGGGNCETGLQGICSAGLLQCNSGALLCVQGSISTTEVCGDGLDNDCNGIADDLDADSDTYLSYNCGGNDCNDADSNIHPGALEICNNSDDNCDGQTDEGLATPITCGIGACYSTGSNICINGQYINMCVPGIPGTEICGDGIDQDCNGSDLACAGCSSAADCADGNPCTTDTCLVGACIHSPITGSMPTTPEAMQMCFYLGTCNAGVPSCNPNPITGGSCDDGNLCTIDTGTYPSCVHTVNTCDDGNSGTIDGCNPADGVCNHFSLGFNWPPTFHFCSWGVCY